MADLVDQPLDAFVRAKKTSGRGRRGARGRSAGAVRKGQAGGFFQANQRVRYSILIFILKCCFFQLSLPFKNLDV